MVELGDEVKCKITGFRGIVTGIAKCLTGCDRIDVRAPMKKDGKMGEGYWFDFHAVEIIKKQKVKAQSVQEPAAKNETRKGGPPSRSF